MRDLKTLPTPRTIEDCQQYLGENTFTIFEKIEFSNITKEAINNKLHDLETRQVPKREVLLNTPDEEITFHWFKNWLHPQLKHFFKQSPHDKRGCSPAVLQRDSQMDFYHTYENGQQNYTYTLDEIKVYSGYVK